MPTDSEATTVGIDSGARLPRTRPFCPHVYLVIRSGVGSGESVYGCASAAALVFLPGAARARVVPPDLGNIGPSSEQDRQLGIVEPIVAKTGWDDALSACKIWWPGTELNRRRQPFQSYVMQYSLNNLTDSRWPPKSLRRRERHANRGLESRVQCRCRRETQSSILR